MSGSAIVYYGNFTPVGDILVFAMCILMSLLMWAAYINKTKSFQIFCGILLMLVLSAVTDILYHICATHVDTVPHLLIYVLRIAYHTCIFGIMVLFVVYTREPLQLDRDTDRKYLALAHVGIIGITVCDISASLAGVGFYITADNEIRHGLNFFPIGYMYYVVLLLYIMLHHRNQVYRKVLFGILSSVGVSVLLISIQGFHRQASFTTATFLFPTLALLYLVHANPYDLELGAVNADAFLDMIAHSHARKKELVLASLYMHEFEGKGKKYPKEIQNVIRGFATRFFRGAILFLVSGGHMILVAEVAKNPKADESLQSMLDNFMMQYPKYRLDYKIIFTHTIDEISENNDYLVMFQYLQRRMQENSVHIVSEKDIAAFREHNYIVQQLEDIDHGGDLNDSRVEVYCQPVLNTRTGKYDTAEALMRLRLEKTGMVFPDRFIPIAESHGVIHTLSKIMLSKTCKKVRELIDAGYHMKRISVNFSMIDVREEDFCPGIERLIQENGIPFEKIAIELTESQNEKDFLLVKEKVAELKQEGIKFYLDDFGTGYSNFDRILELPFDIVKFDRSLVIASSANRRSEMMVSHLAQMFNDMNYSVLYEGVEDVTDEERCLRMCAKYLQGYKYSKPIPIDELTEYFEKLA